MYSLKVEAFSSTLMDDKDDEDRTDLEDHQEAIEFSAGNPRVEHILGTVHLYRHVPSPAVVAAAAAATAAAAAAAAAAAGASSAEKAVATSSAAALPVAPVAFKPLQGSWARAMGSTALASSLKEADAKKKSVAPQLQGSGSQADGGELPADEASIHPTDLLCCLAIPADMSVAAFCTFCGAYLEHIRHMRVIRREAMHKVVCMVLIQFFSPERASAFHRDFNNKAFSCLEPDILCRLVRVREVEIKNGSDVTRVGPFGCCPHADTGAGVAGGSDGAATQCGSSMQTELPTCPVCLERLDEEISGIVTTVCNHRFHSECLQKWGDTSCPVCRYCSMPSAHDSRCNVCGTTMDLWICLICGHVGCGRYRAGHAVDHWKSTDHCFSLELETQTVWDYAGDNYVHRLIQSKTDGKLVELPSPRVSHQHRRSTGSSLNQSSALPRSGNSRTASATAAAAAASLLPGGVDEEFDERSGDGDDEDDELKEAMVASKLDAVAAEYNHLLATQLDSQRQYFEGLLVQAASDAGQRLKEAGAVASAAEVAARNAELAAKDSERKRTGFEKKLADATAALAAAQKEGAFLRSLSDSLLSNQKEFQQQLKQARDELARKDENIKDMQEQVRDLMVYIEAGRVISGSCSEIKDATLLPMPEVQDKPGSGKKGRNKKK